MIQVGDYVSFKYHTNPKDPIGRVDHIIHSPFARRCKKQIIVFWLHSKNKRRYKSDTLRVLKPAEVTLILLTQDFPQGD